MSTYEEFDNTPKKPLIIGYRGIGPNCGITVSALDAISYAEFEIGVTAVRETALTPKYHEWLLDWFYSGEWIEVHKGETL